MNKTSTAQNEEINEILKELVITRIEATMPSNLKLSIGTQSGLSKQQVIEHVKKGDDIGRQVIQMHIRFLKAQATGEFVRALNSVEDD